MSPLVLFVIIIIIMEVFYLFVTLCLLIFMTLIMHILLETCPLVSSPAPQLVLERWLLIMMRVRSPAQVPGPWPGEMGSNERRQSRQEIAWGQ